MLPPGLVELLSALGANFVSDTIIDTAGRLRRRRNADTTALDEAALRDALADALHRALAGPDEQARQAPAQMGQVLRRVDAIGEALLASEQATDAVRADVYRALHALAAEFSDQTWILDDLRVGVTGMQQQLGDIERGQTEQLNLIRGVMLRIVERASPPRWDDEVGPQPAHVPRPTTCSNGCHGSSR